MQSYQQQFIDLALSEGMLAFGEFKLKSGRISPYFFNLGKCCSGHALNILSQCYAQAIQDSRLEFDALFGPAYKGIPLASTTALQLAREFNRSVEFAFNRKEAKDHGEGGVIVGAALAGKRVLIIDDVVTAGTAIRESMNILKAHNATVIGIVVALDRQERGNGTRSALQEVQNEYGVPAINIVCAQDILRYVQESQKEKNDTIAKSIKEYLDQYQAT